MEYSQFRKDTLKVCTKKTFRVTNSYGNKQAWRWLKKNKWLNLQSPISERDFGLLIKSVNKLLREQLLEGRDIKLPYMMGRIELRKKESYIKFIDGKLCTNLPVNWQKTLKLWYEDTQARENKTLIKQEVPSVFRVFYNRSKAKYNNKTFYQFIPIRAIKLALKEKIDNDEIDALLLCNIPT